jgi:hypothetical protein
MSEPGVPPQQPNPGQQSWNPAQQGGVPQGAPPPAPAARPSRGRKIGGILVAVLILAAIAAFSWFMGRDDATKAKVGDCLKQTGDNSVQVVECSDSEATLKVVGRVEDKTQIEAQLSACDAFEGAESTYWEGKQGEKGLVLCLAKNTK